MMFLHFWLYAMLTGVEEEGRIGEESVWTVAMSNRKLILRSASSQCRKRLLLVYVRGRLSILGFSAIHCTLVCFLNSSFEQFDVYCKSFSNIQYEPCNSHHFSFIYFSFLFFSTSPCRNRLCCMCVCFFLDDFSNLVEFLVFVSA